MGQKLSSVLDGGVIHYSDIPFDFHEKVLPFLDKKWLINSWNTKNFCNPFKKKIVLLRILFFCIIFAVNLSVDFI